MYKYICNKLRLVLCYSKFRVIGQSSDNFRRLSKVVNLEVTTNKPRSTTNILHSIIKDIEHSCWRHYAVTQPSLCMYIYVYVCIVNVDVYVRPTKLC